MEKKKHVASYSVASYAASSIAYLDLGVSGALSGHSVCHPATRHPARYRGNTTSPHELPGILNTTAE
jgi:hypothetical protein